MRASLNLITDIIGEAGAKATKTIYDKEDFRNKVIKKILDFMDPSKNPASLTYSNTGRLLVFKLGGTESLPSPTLRDMTIPEQQIVAVSDEDLAKGEVLYHDFCAPCHGLVVRSGGVIADLRMMGAGSHTNFDAIVLGGLMEGAGMASFADSLTPDDTSLIHNYVKARAHEDRGLALGEPDAGRLTGLK